MGNDFPSLANQWENSLAYAHFMRNIKLIQLNKVALDNFIFFRIENSFNGKWNNRIVVDFGDLFHFYISVCLFGWECYVKREEISWNRWRATEFHWTAGIRWVYHWNIPLQAVLSLIILIITFTFDDCWLTARSVTIQCKPSVF